MCSFLKKLFYSQQIKKKYFYFLLEKKKKRSFVLVNNPLTCLPNQYLSYILWGPADQNVKLWSLA